MKIQCSWCGKDMGEKPPYEDTSVTHSICEECREKYFPTKEVGDMDEIRAKAIAEEAAVKAVELQGNKIAQLVAKELSGELLHHSPVSEHCERVLEDLEARKIPCWDFRKSRSAVLCLAWKMLEERKLPSLPVSEAWQVLRRQCARE